MSGITAWTLGAHDLIPWSRQTRFRPRMLMDLVAQTRTGFEHWTHDAAIFPMQLYPIRRLKFARDTPGFQRPCAMTVMT